MNSSKLKAMQTIHLAFCLAIVLMAATSYLTVKDRLYLDADLNQNDVFFPLFPLIGLVSIALGQFLFKKQLSNVQELSADDKINKYQVAFLMRTALFELPALLNIVGFLVSGNIVFLIAGVVFFMLLVSARPSKQAITEALNLNYPDTEKL
ncbi:hypothetical protein [Pedobacter sp. V48]|uniref:hypothetical protein n=1 Tax=Pedobacter sp. V48 TaxID=509635 RepID=UPI0003E5C354|nr:hypothetical protein [Pedobacter sp. V48]ETZ19291.1 hypothetical protein N824_11155 [Pedobacter sp. V48]